MNLPVRQHTIPKTYLRYFSIDEKKISVCQLDNGSFRTQNLNNVPVIKNFYTVTDEENGGKKLYDFESFLADQIEPVYTPYIKMIENGDILGEVQKIHFAYFISTQKLRTEKMKNIIIQEIERVFRDGTPGEWFNQTSLNQFTTKFFEGNTPITYNDFIKKSSSGKPMDVNVAKDCFVQFLPDKIIELAEELSSKSWGYLVAGQKRSFITSDAPVILENEFSDPSLSLEGGVFPLTPNLALNIGANKEGSRKVSAKEVRKINQLILHHSYRFVLSHDEGFLRTIVG